MNEEPKSYIANSIVLKYDVSQLSNPPKGRELMDLKCFFELWVDMKGFRSQKFGGISASDKALTTMLEGKIQWEPFELEK